MESQKNVNSPTYENDFVLCKHEVYITNLHKVAIKTLTVTTIILIFKIHLSELLSFQGTCSPADVEHVNEFIYQNLMQKTASKSIQK